MSTFLDEPSAFTVDEQAKFRAARAIRQQVDADAGLGVAPPTTEDPELATFKRAREISRRREHEKTLASPKAPPPIRINAGIQASKARGQEAAQAVQGAKQAAALSMEPEDLARRVVQLHTKFAGDPEKTSNALAREGWDKSLITPKFLAAIDNEIGGIQQGVQQMLQAPQPGQQQDHEGVAENAQMMAQQAMGQVQSLQALKAQLMKEKDGDSLIAKTAPQDIDPTPMERPITESLSSSLQAQQQAMQMQPRGGIVNKPKGEVGAAAGYQQAIRAFVKPADISTPEGFRATSGGSTMGPLPEEGFFEGVGTGAKQGWKEAAPALLGGNRDQAHRMNAGEGVGAWLGRTGSSLVGGLVNPEQLPANVLGYITGAKAVQLAEPILGPVAKIAGNKAAAMVEHMVGGVAGMAPISGVQATTQAAQSGKLAEDPLGAAGDIAKATASGAAFGAGLGAVTGAAGKYTPREGPGATVPELLGGRTAAEPATFTPEAAAAQTAALEAFRPAPGPAFEVPGRLADLTWHLIDTKLDPAMVSRQVHSDLIEQGMAPAEARAVASAAATVHLATEEAIKADPAVRDVLDHSPNPEQARATLAVIAEAEVAGRMQDRPAFEDVADRQPKQRPNEADDDYSRRLFAHNAREVADNPDAATLRNLERATQFWDRALAHEQAKGADASLDVARSLEVERDALNIRLRPLWKEMEAVGLDRNEAADWPQSEIRNVIKARKRRMSEAAAVPESTPEIKAPLTEPGQDSGSVLPPVVSGEVGVHGGESVPSSVISDASGKPLTVYHGTARAFDKFNAPEGGIFFSDTPDLAKQYADHPGPWMSRTPPEGARVVESHISMKNPLVIDAAGKRNDNIPFPGQPWKAKVFGNLPKDAVSVSEAAKRAKAMGHDGLIVKNVVDTKIPGDTTKSTVYAVFDAEQVHSKASPDSPPLSPKATAEPPSSSSQPKQPWEMTREEYASDAGQRYTKKMGRPMEASIVSGVEESAYNQHARVVERALSEGHPVPPEVLKDYPDLAPKSEPQPIGNSISESFMEWARKHDLEAIDRAEVVRKHEEQANVEAAAGSDGSKSGGGSGIEGAADVPLRTPAAGYIDAGKHLHELTVGDKFIHGGLPWEVTIPAKDVFDRVSARSLNINTHVRSKEFPNGTEHVKSFEGRKTTEEPHAVDAGGVVGYGQSLESLPVGQRFVLKAGGPVYEMVSHTPGEGRKQGYSTIRNLKTGKEENQVGGTTDYPTKEERRAIAAKEIADDAAKREAARAADPTIKLVHDTGDVRVWQHLQPEGDWQTPKKNAAFAKALEKIKNDSGKAPNPPSIGKYRPTDPTKLSSLPKEYATTADKLGHLGDLAGDGKSKYRPSAVLVEDGGARAIATDGNSLSILRGDKGEFGKPGQYAEGKGKPLAGDDIQPFPEYKDIIDDTKKSDPIAQINVEKTYRDAKKMKAMLDPEQRNQVVVVLNKDGTLGFSSIVAEVGQAEVNVYGGSKVLGAMDHRRIMDALELAHRSGTTDAVLRWPGPDKPMRLDTERSTSIQMPIKPEEAMEPGLDTPNEPTRAEPNTTAGELAVGDTFTHGMNRDLIVERQGEHFTNYRNPVDDFRGEIEKDAPVHSEKAPKGGSGSMSAMGSPGTPLPAPPGAAIKGTKIGVDPLPGKAKPIKDILVTLKEGVGNVRTGKPAKGSIGTYYPGSSKTVIGFANDLDTAAHEVAHRLDDLHGIVGDWALPKKYNKAGVGIPQRSPFDVELGIGKKAYAMQPIFQQTIKDGYSIVQKRAEGVAEYLRAWMLNPAEAERLAPQFSAWFKSKVPAEHLDAIRTFGDEVRQWAGSSNTERVLSNVDVGIEAKGIIQKVKEAFESEGVGGSFLDKINAALNDSLAPVWKGVALAKELRGIDELIPAKDPQKRIRLLAGFDRKAMDVMEKGPIDFQGNRLKGMGGVDWLLEPLKSDTRKALEADFKDTIAFGLSERVVERAGILDKAVADVKALSKEGAELAAELRKAEAEAGGPLDGSAVERLQEIKDEIARIKKKVGYDGPLHRMAWWAEGKKARMSGFGAGIYNDTKTAEAALTELRSDPARLKRITEAARRYRQWGDSLLEYMTEAGRISADQRDAIRESNNYYFAMKRLHEDVDGSLFGAGGGRRISSVKQTIQKFMGSTRTIENPYASLIEQTYSMMKEADRNAALRTFTDLLKSSRDMYRGKPTDFDQIGSVAKAGDPDTVKVFNKGKEVAWQFAPAIHKALKNWGINETPHFLLRAAQAPIQLTRSLITLSPQFVIRQQIRDPIARAIISDSGSKPWSHLYFVTHPEEFSKTLSEFERSGGGLFGHQVIGREAYYAKMREAMREAAGETGPIRTILSTPAHAYRAYKRLVEIGEESGRLGEYRTAYKRAIDKGMDEYNARMSAAYEARNIQDFAIAGTLTKALNQWVIFTSAAVRGVVRSGEAAVAHPGRTAARMVMYVGALEAMNYAWNAYNGHDEDVRKLNAYRRDLFWNFKLGDSAWLTIPKPYELGVMGSGFSRAIDSARGEPDAFKGFFGSLWRATVPLDEKDLIGPYPDLVEVMSNHSFFTDRPIIPEYERKKPPGQDEAGKWNRPGEDRASGAGKLLGQAMGVDARYLDRLLTGRAGGFGQLAIDATGETPASGLAMRSSGLLMAQRSTDGFYAALADAETQGSAPNASPEDISRMRLLRSYQRSIGSIRKAVQSGGITKDEGDRTIKALVSKALAEAEQSATAAR